MRRANPEVEPRLLSPDRAAIYLGLGSRWSIYRLVSTGQLPAMKLAGKIRIDREDLDALIAASKCQAADRSPSRPPPATASVPARLAPLPERRRLRSATPAIE